MILFIDASFILFLSNSTFAFSEAKLTLAFTTPSALEMDFSIVCAQVAQCIPEIRIAVFCMWFVGSGFFEVFSVDFIFNVFLFDADFSSALFFNDLNLSWQLLLQK